MLRNATKRRLERMELFTVKEAAEKLKTNTNTVYKLIRGQHITALKLGRYKIPDYELERFIKENQGMDITDLDNIKPLYEEN
jgi:excisionase family DNA binding protein